MFKIPYKNLDRVECVLKVWFTKNNVLLEGQFRKVTPINSECVG